MTEFEQTQALDNRVRAILSKISILELEVKNKEAAIGNATWLTTCQPKNANIKSLHVANTSDIVDFITFLFSQDQARQKAIETLGVNAQDFQAKYDGFPLSDWVKDAQKRIALNDIKDLKQKIKNGMSKVEALKSEVQKRTDAIADLEKEFE